MKNWGGHFTPELGGHFELESGAHFKLELGGQYHRNMHCEPSALLSLSGSKPCHFVKLYKFSPCNVNDRSVMNEFPKYFLGTLYPI